MQFLTIITLLQNKKDSNTFHIIILGNKFDYKSLRQVSTEEGEELARFLNNGF